MLIEEYLKPEGINVLTDIDEGQQMLDAANGKAKLSKDKKKTVETAPLNPKKGSLADISTVSGAKILKKD